MITPQLRQNNVATSFSNNNDIIITLHYVAICAVKNSIRWATAIKVYHYDVTQWKRFTRFRPFVKGIQNSHKGPTQWAANADSEAYWRIYASLKRIVISSDNGFTPMLHKAIA